MRTIISISSRVAPRSMRSRSVVRICSTIRLGRYPDRSRPNRTGLQTTNWPSRGSSVDLIEPPLRRSQTMSQCTAELFTPPLSG